MKNLKEFDYPIRIYWDLTDEKNVNVDQSPGPEIVKKICDEIIGIKVLNLNLLDSGPSLCPATIQILERLKNENLAVTLTASGKAIGPAIADSLEEMHVKALFLDAETIDEAGTASKTVNSLKAGLPAGIYFRVNRQNYKDLPEVLGLCVDSGMSYLVLPMQRLVPGSDCFYVSRTEREELTARLDKISRPESLKIIINDPFLWKAFYPTLQYHEGGCQAANSMIYISPSGGVLPCPAMHIKLGDLTAEPLKVIVRSDTKTTLRKGLEGLPPGCEGCEEHASCLGGCRGRTFALEGTLDKPDPSCR